METRGGAPLTRVAPRSGPPAPSPARPRPRCEALWSSTLGRSPGGSGGIARQSGGVPGGPADPRRPRPNLLPPERHGGPPPTGSRADLEGVRARRDQGAAHPARLPGGLPRQRGAGEHPPEVPPHPPRRGSRGDRRRRRPARGPRGQGVDEFGFHSDRPIVLPGSPGPRAGSRGIGPRSPRTPLDPPDAGSRGRGVASPGEPSVGRSPAATETPPAGGREGSGTPLRRPGFVPRVRASGAGPHPIPKSETANETANAPKSISH